MEASAAPDALYAVSFAAFGGLCINLFSLLELRWVPKAKRPDLTDLFYWAPFVAWPAVAAVLAFAYVSSGIELTPIVSINVGASAPLILRSMAQATPPLDLSRT